MSEDTVHICCGDAKCDGVACKCNEAQSVLEVKGKLPGFDAVDLSGVKTVMVVEDDQRSIFRAELEERVLTKDEARAQVCRSVAEMLERSIAETEAELKKAVDAKQVGVQEKTGALIVVAARELRAMMLSTANKLDRPRILQPRRSMKVVR